MIKRAWSTLDYSWKYASLPSSDHVSDAGVSRKQNRDVSAAKEADAPSEKNGFEAYQLAAFKQMPRVDIPEPSEIIVSLPSHVRAIIDSEPGSKTAAKSLSTRMLSELSQPEFEQLLTARAMERDLPIDILAALFAAGPRLDHPGHVLKLMQTYWRRLIHWEDVRDLVAMVMRRQFDWSGPSHPDPVAVQASRSIREDGYALLPNSFSPTQIAEIHEYFRSRPGLNRHVPDGSPDQIRRYVGYGADDYSFCSYPLCDIVLAPYLLEAVVNPRIAEIGYRLFGAVPHLRKIFTHWDLPGSKFLAGHGTSIGHYHRDLNDPGMMWVYVYLTDVDHDSGPHGIVPGSQSCGNIGLWLEEARDLGVDIRHGARHLTRDDFFDGYGYHIRIEAKEAIFADREVVITGPGGTTFITNGFNYHRIVSPQTQPRLLCAARYYLTYPGQLDSPQRDTDKIPFGLVKDRIGDTELIREVTAKFVDWRSPRPPRRQTSGRVGFEKKYFLIISNGRSGSTWLQTSLGSLNEIRTDYEYRWSLPLGTEGNPVHYVVPRHPATILESLDAFVGDARIVGSKLTFGLEWIQRQNVFEKLQVYFDDRITYIFLTRPYIELLASFLLRGPVHDLSPCGAEGEKKNLLLGQLRQASERSNLAQRTFGGDKWEVFRALRFLVNNDVIGFGICERFASSIHVSYDRIPIEFERVVRKVGWNGDTRELHDVLDAPAVRKLPTLDWANLPEAEIFAAYTKRLDSTLHTAILERWTVEHLHRIQSATLNALRTELSTGSALPD